MNSIVKASENAERDSSYLAAFENLLCNKSCSRCSLALGCRLEAKINFLELVAVALLLALALGGLDTNFLVVLLKGCEIFTSLAEFTFLHTFPDVVMHEGTLGVHQIELVVNARHDFRDRRAVRDHAARAHDLR